ncbi:MAG: DUF480 domain-containing protein [bacterium]
MNLVLTAIETRVLGCLLEKETTTPDNYPLTLNALVNACNQKSSRNPLMSLGETDVVRAIDSLRDKRLVSTRHSSGSRVPKYAHEFQIVCDFTPAERATLCALMLRGPLTGGEIRSCTASQHKFSSLEEVELTLQQLVERGDGPFVMKLPRQAGRKESRFAHLFCGAVEVDDAAAVPSPEPATLAVRAEDERMQSLEQQVAALRAEVEQLRIRVEGIDKPIL